VTNGSGLLRDSFAKREGARTRRPLLIAGATGTLGRTFARICELRGVDYRLISRAEMDITDRSSVARAIGEHRPWAIINAAGYVRVDDAELDEDRCHRENAEGPSNLAEASIEHGLSFVTFSSDLVFDGRQRSPYTESALPSPLNAYGRSKARAEERVLAINPHALIVRTSAFFGPWDDYNFVTTTLRALSNRTQVTVADDTTISPTYVPDLVDETLNLLVDGEHGIWHLANAGELTWYELACSVATMAGLDCSLVVGRPTEELGWIAPRPRYTPLASERGSLLPTLDHALVRYFTDLEKTARCSARAMHSQVYGE
jgi:dTDP-4-dehydrorhamnose reductase